MANENLGSDFYCIDDIDPGLSVVSGKTCLAQAIARRLITPNGGLFYFEEYGLDLRSYLGSAKATGPIASAVQYECCADERVHDAAVSAVFLDVNGQPTIDTTLVDSIELGIRLESTSGTVSLTLSVGDVTSLVLNK